MALRYSIARSQAVSMPAGHLLMSALLAMSPTAPVIVLQLKRMVTMKWMTPMMVDELGPHSTKSKSIRLRKNSWHYFER